MSSLNPELLLQQKRGSLVELEFYGFLLLLDENGLVKKIGDDKNNPFFHRSCAKPLQASLIQDYDTDSFYGLTEEEIAVCCGSHAGERCHIDVLKGLLKKGGLQEDDLRCPIIPPLNNFDGLKNFSPLHNNCSGKHVMMLLLCAQNGWNRKDYLSFEHPLQKKILSKLEFLCEEKGLISTLDGCGAPNWASSLEALGRGFLKFVQTHTKISSSMQNKPYFAGGQNRLDTHIMQSAFHTVAKVGAGGLCVIVNTRTNESLVIKVIDADMKARTIIALEALRQLSWVNINSIDTNLLKYFDSSVYTQTGVRVGEYTPCFKL